MTRPLQLIVLLLAVSAHTACDVGDERKSWLHSALTAEHRLLHLRAPDLLADKYAAMAAHPFDYFRGTLGLWIRDTTEPSGHGQSASVFASPAVAQLLLVGDPHPENVGTFLPSAPGQPAAARSRTGPTSDLRIEFNDFDAATFGPPTHDLRRLATGLRLLVLPSAPDQLSPSADTLDEAVRALTRGYLDALMGGTPPPRGRIAEDLIRRANEDRSAAASLDADDPDDELVPATPEERAFITRLLLRWPATCLADCPAATATSIKNIARRYGAGVASLPLYRFYVLLEGATSDADDDLILELKEAREAPTLATLPGFYAMPVSNNAERVVFAQRILQSTPLADPLLGIALLDDDPRTSFRVKERSTAQKGLSRTRIAERLADQRWTDDDLIALSAYVGHLLGQAHARAPLGPDTDTTAHDHLASLAATSGDALIDETVAFSAFMAERIVLDHSLFRELLDAHGPTLEPDAP